MTEEPIDGPTPSGGVRAIIYYFDDDHAPAEKDVATGCEAVEFDADGKAIHRTYMALTPRPADAPQ